MRVRENLDPKAVQSIKTSVFYFHMVKLLVRLIIVPALICLQTLSLEWVASEANDLNAILEACSGCGNTFHKHCLETWFAVNPTCPACRSRRVYSDDDACRDEEMGDQSRSEQNELPFRSPFVSIFVRGSQSRPEHADSTVALFLFMLFSISTGLVWLVIVSIISF